MALAGAGVNAAIGLATSASGAIVKSIKNASDLNSTLAKTGTIFGGSASTIVDEAGRLSAAFGVSKNEFINSSANFGAVFKGIGKSQSDAASMGVSLGKLALDMAAFDDTTNAEAFGAVSSALKGEFDPIERYRVFLSAAKIEKEAFALGFKKVDGALSEEAKKMATVSLITKQTGDAQGALAREANESGSQFRMLAGTVENLGTNLGQLLLPGVLSITQGLNAMASSALAAFEGSGASFQSWIDGFGVMIANGELLLGEFTTNLGIFGEWFVGNFSKLLADGVNAASTVLMNGFANIGEIILALPKIMASGGSMEGVLQHGLFDGWKRQSAEMPEFFHAQLVTMEDMAAEAGNKLGGAAGAKPSTSGDWLTDIFGADAMAPRKKEASSFNPDDPLGFGFGSDKAKKEVAGFSASLVGTQDFTSAIARHANQGGASDDKPIKDVARTNQMQLDEQRKQTGILEAIASSGGGGGGLMAFPI